MSKQLFPALGVTLERHRALRDLPKRRMAEFVGISERHYYQFLRGEIDPRLSTLLKICSALGITPAKFLEGVVED